MVNRPPPSGGGSARNDGDDDAAAPQDAGGRRKLGHLQWSLRSLHKIDTSAQHFLDDYYEEAESQMQGGLSPHGTPATVLEDQTAFEIFKGPQGDGNDRANKLWHAHEAPMRTAVVDGKKMVFELKTDVTQKPTTPRRDRVNISHEVINSDQSPWDVRARFVLMHVALTPLAVAFLVAFVIMNVCFAGFFYALDDHCCGDASMTFANVFAFTVQTSTTIGYGGYMPRGVIADLLVIVLSYLSTLINTLFAGLLFTKFVTPSINIQFSDVMTMCNVNGVPCLTVRMGNAEGHLNRLTDVNVRLTCSYHIPYQDHKGKDQFFHQNEELRLLSNRQQGMLAGWELRHVLDETSPLFGLHFEEHPANKIYVLNLSVDATQYLTKSSVNVQTDYALEDIMIGHSFQEMVVSDGDPKRLVSDYSKMSDTEPYPVWYPSRTGVHETEEKIPPRSFGPA